MRVFNPPSVFNSPQSDLVEQSINGLSWYRHNFVFANGFESISTILLPCLEAFARIQIIQTDTVLMTLDTRLYALWKDHTSVIRGHPSQLLVHIARCWRSFVQTYFTFTQPVVVRVDVSHPGPVSLSICPHIPISTTLPTANRTTPQSQPQSQPQPHTTPLLATPLSMRAGVIHTSVFLSSTVPLSTAVPPVSPPLPSDPILATAAGETEATQTAPETEVHRPVPSVGGRPYQSTLVKNIVAMSMDSSMGATTFEEARNIHGLFVDFDYFCPMRIYFHRANQSPLGEQEYVDYISPLQFVLTEQLTDQRFRAYLPISDFHDHWSVFTLIHQPTIQLLTPLHPVSGVVYALSMSLVDPIHAVQTSNHQDMVNHHNQVNRPGSLLSSLVQFINRVAESTQAMNGANAEQATNSQQITTQPPPPPPSLINRSQAIYRPLLGEASESTDANRTCNITLREIDVDQYYTLCPQCTKVFDLDAFLTWWRINPTCPTCRHADTQSWQCYRNSIMRASQEDQDPMELHPLSSSPISPPTSSPSSSYFHTPMSSPSSRQQSAVSPNEDDDPNGEERTMNLEHPLPPPPHLISGLILPIASSVSAWSTTQGQSFFQSSLELSHEEEFDLDMFETETFFFQIPNPSDDTE